METTSNVVVVEKVRKRIAELEQAIQRLDFVKRHLNQNSSEIKSQIHSSISRQLETLRNREVWLLEQVDTVLVAKEDVLQGQQARLNKALGVLHSSLTHAADTDDDAVARHLVQALEQLNGMDLKAEETPYIAFRADQVALRESILSYGRVDANGMPFLSAFSDEDKPSASLPRHLEEYEDSEHHLFYKALQDSKEGATSIRVCMPKLSSRVEDWLQRPMLELSTPDPQCQTPGGERGGTPVSQTSCSIQNWLSQIKHNPDVEEDDDFEIVDHSGSSQRESPVGEEPRPQLASVQQDFVDVFRHIPRDIRQWLFQGGNCGSGPGEEDLRAFFNHIPKDTSMWLATARQQLESLDELKRGGWFRHIPKEMSTWLRRAHDKRSPSVPPTMTDMFSHIPSDKCTWLGKRAAESDQEASVSAKEGRESSLPTPLSSIPDLMKDYFVTFPVAMETWLRKPETGVITTTTADDAGLSTLPGIQRYLSGNSNNNSNSAWLAPSSQGAAVEAEVPEEPTGFFSHISRQKSHWLRDGPLQGNNSSPSQGIDLKSAVRMDTRQWLQSRSAFFTDTAGTLPASPLDSLRQAFSHMSTTDWLQGGESRDGEASDQSWTVCSSESSVSSVSSLQSAFSAHPSPPLDLTAWIYQKCL